MRKTNPKLESQILVFFGFFVKAIKWLTGLPSSAAELSYQRPNYCGLRLSKVAGYAFISYEANPLKIKLL